MPRASGGMLFGPWMRKTEPGRTEAREPAGGNAPRLALPEGPQEARQGPGVCLATAVLNTASLGLWQSYRGCAQIGGVPVARPPPDR
jgi:hypothetical protein